MTKQIIETFPQTIEFDSVYTSCIEDLLSTLNIRVRVGNKTMEYQFYDILEYNQVFVDANIPSQLCIQTKSQALQELLERAPEIVTLDPELPPYKHYVWNINGTEFSLFATEYVKQDVFMEVYREQEKVKQIIV